MNTPPREITMQMELEPIFRSILEKVFEGVPEDEHLADTPRRMAKAMVLDYFWGLWEDPAEVMKRGIFTSKSDEMIICKDMDFVSFCAHHFVPFIGKAYIAYIPNKKLVGLSKIPRVLDIFSHRPQVQERLTTQIADCLMKELKPKGVAVLLEAEHLCVAIRGVKKPGAKTRTTALRGNFLTSSSTKAEFLASVGL